MTPGVREKVALSYVLLVLSSFARCENVTLCRFHSVHKSVLIMTDSHRTVRAVVGVRAVCQVCHDCMALCSVDGPTLLRGAVDEHGRSPCSFQRSAAPCCFCAPYRMHLQCGSGTYTAGGQVGDEGANLWWKIKTLNTCGPLRSASCLEEGTYVHAVWGFEL